MDSNSVGTSNKVGLAVDHRNVILSGQHWGDSGGVVHPESEEDNPCLYGEEHTHLIYRLLRGKKYCILLDKNLND